MPREVRNASRSSAYTRYCPPGVMNALRNPFLIQLIAVWLTTPQMSATSRAEKICTFFSFFAMSAILSIACGLFLNTIQYNNYIHNVNV